MPDTCASKPQLVDVLAGRDKVVDHLDTSPRAQLLLSDRLRNYDTPEAAWAQTVQDILPDLAPSLRDDVAKAARRAWSNRAPRMIKQVRRAMRFA
jgi:hypothetical protein